jgi:hypothetical protein
MTPLLIIAAVVIVPWVAVVAVIVAVLHHAAVVGARMDAIAAHPSTTRACPLCHVEGVALIDPDGVALCTSCRCSYESVQL